jgi:hypothetical protein
MAAIRMSWAPFRKEDMQRLLSLIAASLLLPYISRRYRVAANDRRIPERSAVTTETDEQAINSSQQMHSCRKGP